MSAEIRKKYTVTIGIECHVQLKTKTKLFSAAGNDSREAAPNTHISHIDLGMPGALPVLNEAAVELGMKAAFALGTTPQKFSEFDRKHYFYPDLPTGYQITQFYHPIIIGGEVRIEVDGQEKIVKIHEAHLEADAGKSIHPPGKDYSLVDLNRAGTPLLEIVSEPDMHSAEEAKVYAKELYLRMRYAGVSEANMYYGNMRFDVNLSVSTNDVLGTRSETKNLNSFRSIERAIEFETERQIELFEKGEKVVQETRGWDDAKQRTFTQRSKEEAHDYRYMPDPDIPPLVLSDEMIEKVRSTMPALPGEVREKFMGLQLDSSSVDTLVEEMPAGRFVLTLLDSGCKTADVKRVANWLTSEVQALVANDKISWETAKLDVANFKQLAEMTSSNKVSSTGAKAILIDMVQIGGSPAEIAEAKNLLQVSDEDEINDIVKQVLAENPKAAEDVRNGEAKAIGFLVGQIMKASKGQANPSVAQDLIKKQLN
ncbi:Asp-tRNA(Asn)/Glu-tRNA(Gln) amidotransferase subunit GatB [Candidatus Saccharibacteria bacterium]|nr:Asp-tRNA(Asn)/Glu-tRNA(Gln) amidotransferase subunit GatB [Candidatus Saccharibacteria bacterium]